MTRLKQSIIKCYCNCIFFFPMLISARTDSVAAAAAAATFNKDLTIDVGDALQDGTPPVPRLEWDVHSTEMGSPITPSRYGKHGTD